MFSHFSDFTGRRASWPWAFGRIYIFLDTQKNRLAGEEAERVQAEICVCTQSSTIFGFSDLFISKWPFGGAEVDTWGRHGVVDMVKGERLR